VLNQYQLNHELRYPNVLNVIPPMSSLLRHRDWDVSTQFWWSKVIGLVIGIVGQ
jgi:hypothetical protein